MPGSARLRAAALAVAALASACVAIAAAAADAADDSASERPADDSADDRATDTARARASDAATPAPDADAPVAPEAAEAVAAIDAQRAVIERTRSLVADKRAARARELRARVRAAYRLLRAGYAPLWVDRAAAAELAGRRAAVRRVLARDRRELALLDDELAAVAAARRELARDRDRAARARPPAPGSLRVPVIRGRVVAPFGVHRDAASGARLSRRGVALSARPGRNVRALADGVVRWAGPVRGVGDVVVVAHDGFLSVLGPVAPIRVERGQTVARGDLLGESASDRLDLEIRLDTGGPGVAIDPAPLLAP